MTLILPGSITTVPLAGWVTLSIARRSPSTSRSLASTKMVSAESWSVVVRLSTPTGGSLAGVTTMEIEATSVSPIPSLTSYTKLSGPL